MATVDVIANRSTASEILGKAYFETDTNSFIVYNGSGWVELQSDGTGAAPPFSEYSVDFDGTNDYLSIPSSTDFDFGTEDFSISMWFNLSSVGTPGNEWGGLIYRSLQYRLKFQGNSSDINFDTPGGNKNIVRYGSSLLNSWHHLVISTDRTTHEMKSYIDGSLHRTVSVSSTESISAAGQPLFIGNHYNTYYLGGLVDEVSIFHSTLSASDVTAIYNSGVPADISSLSPAGWWRMGDDSNDSPVDGGNVTGIQDSSGNGNHATQSTASRQPTFSTEVPA
jgi:hypothetical protein